MSRMICSIYRSTKKDETYLYVNKSRGLGCVPEGLVELFGAPREAMTLLLTPDKKLARADIQKVLAALEEQGYYLQLPPSSETYMQEINKHNDKLY
jgi:uncharacterized protein YcgL (UPF0745 family)